MSEKHREALSEIARLHKAWEPGDKKRCSDCGHTHTYRSTGKYASWARCDDKDCVCSALRPLTPFQIATEALS